MWAIAKIDVATKQPTFATDQGKQFVFRRREDAAAWLKDHPSFSRRKFEVWRLKLNGKVAHKGEALRRSIEACMKACIAANGKTTN